MIKIIASSAKISTKMIKDGSNKGRDNYCRKLEDKLYNRLIKYKRSQLDYIGKNISDILPSKLIQVEKLHQSEDLYKGAVNLARGVKKTIPAEIVGYIVSFKTGCKKEHFGGVSFDVLMHEMHHLFNYLTHPKIPNRIYKISKFSSDNNFQEFFVKYFQSPMPPYKCKEATEKLLEKEKEHKIDLLQYFRYKLHDEIGAYKSGEYYADLHRKINRDITKSNVHTLYLHEKLVDITMMLCEALKNERKYQ